MLEQLNDSHPFTKIKKEREKRWKHFTCLFIAAVKTCYTESWNGPAPCPAEYQTCPTLENPPLLWGDYSNG